MLGMPVRPVLEGITWNSTVVLRKPRSAYAYHQNVLGGLVTSPVPFPEDADGRTKFIVWVCATPALGFPVLTWFASPCGTSEADAKVGDAPTA